MSTVPGLPAPRPSTRSLLALHVACAFPLVALAVWFGLVDRLEYGESRCDGCGVEGYVIVAHVLAALWLGAVVVWAAAARRQTLGGIRAPGGATIAALVAVAVFIAACVRWHVLLDWPATLALLASFVTLPAAAIWWLVSFPELRDPQLDDRQLCRRLRDELIRAWTALVLLLPAIFAWVWSSRVDWLLF